MRMLILGGSASGKSDYAEKWLCERCKGKKLYIATMHPWDKESEERIEKHRKRRANLGFQTLECYTGLQNTEIPECEGILLECLTNLSANERYDAQGAGEGAEDSILAGIRRLSDAVPELAVVSGDLFGDGICYDAETEEYLRLLASLNASLAEEFDAVTEVVCGIPLERKAAGKKGKHLEKHS